MQTNRMTDALKLFGDVVNNKWFEAVNIVVFLNKKDLFATKVEKVPLKVRNCSFFFLKKKKKFVNLFLKKKVGFPDYSGPNTYEAGMKYIGELIRSIDKSPEGREA